MSRRPSSRGSMLSFFAFVAVLLLGLGITIGVILGNWVDGAASVAGWIKDISIALGLVVALLFSYREARRHGTVWFVLWVIAVILIVVFYILSLPVWNF